MKLENTTLAYPINKSTKAQYIVYTLEAKSELIAEFTRRANIAKFIWRQMVINLDTEKGFQKSKKHSNTELLKMQKVVNKGTGVKQLIENLEKTISHKTKPNFKKEVKKSN